MVARLIPAALAIALLSACGATHPATPSSTSPASAGSGRLSIRPAAPKTNTPITFAFSAPVSGGRHGPSVLSFALTLEGPRRSGCVGARTGAFPDAVKGRLASVTLAGHWCPGTYLARVQEFAQPFCKPDQMCPQYVRLVGTVASARFRISPV